MHHGPLRTTTPSTRINDDLVLESRYYNILLKHQHVFLNKTHKHPLIEGDSNELDSQFFAEFLKKSFVYVITETVCEYPYPYFTEKTWKAMISKVPFMIVGSRNSLRKLKNFGFKTFDSWWSEKYDTLPTAAERIESLVLELKKISRMDLKELSHIRNEMRPTLDHNFNQIKIFKINDLNNIKNKI